MDNEKNHNTNPDPPILSATLADRKHLQLPAWKLLTAIAIALISIFAIYQLFSFMQNRRYKKLISQLPALTVTELAELPSEITIDYRPVGKFILIKRTCPANSPLLENLPGRPQTEKQKTFALKPIGQNVIIFNKLIFPENQKEQTIKKLDEILTTRQSQPAEPPAPN
jgi:hypothetical protein